MDDNQTSIENSVKRLAAAKYARALIAHEDGRIDDAAKFASDAVWFAPTNTKYAEYSQIMQSLLSKNKELL